MSETLPCPVSDDWQRHLDGDLPEGRDAELTAHLGGCESCQKTVETLAAGGDTLLKVAGQAGAETTEAEPALREVLAKIPNPFDETQAAKKEKVDVDYSFLQAPKEPGHLGQLGHYAILELVGRGGFGLVFRALDEKLRRVVAIKVLAPELAANAGARRRFVKEAQSVAAVKNEHVIAIYEVQETHQPPYLAMEFVEGQSLQQKIDRAGQLGTTAILRIGMQMAEGLAAAHKQGLIHRDIKPANVLLENGVERVKITDFGLARASDDATATHSGIIAGTPAYMSPEQAHGDSIDGRSDLFSLGSVLYAMAAGHAPFSASSAMAVLLRVTEKEPKPLRKINPDFPDWLADIIAKLHAKKPADRFQSAREVADCLGQWLAHVQQPSTTTRPVEPTSRSPRKFARQFSARRVAAMVLPAILIGSIAWYFLHTLATGYRIAPHVAFEPENTVRNIWQADVAKGFVRPPAIEDKNWDGRKDFESKKEELPEPMNPPPFNSVQAPMPQIPSVGPPPFNGNSLPPMPDSPPPGVARYSQQAIVAEQRRLQAKEVLDQLAGAAGVWATDVNLLLPLPGEAQQAHGVAHATRECRGRYLRLRTYGWPDSLDMLQFIDFSEKNGEFQTWLFDSIGNDFSSMRGTWDAATEMLTFTFSDEKLDRSAKQTIGFHSQGVPPFEQALRQGPNVVFSERVDCALKVNFAAPKVTTGLTWVMVDKRRQIINGGIPQPPPPPPPAEPILPANKPQEVLFQLAGESLMDVDNKPTPGNPKADRAILRVQWTKSLGGLIMEGNVHDPIAGESTCLLAYYDTGSNAYRLWTLPDKGEPTRATGTFDDTTKVLKWAMASSDGAKTNTEWDFSNSGRCDWTIKTFDKNGVLLLDSKCTARERVKEAAPLPPAVKESDPKRAFNPLEESLRKLESLRNSINALKTPPPLPEPPQVEPSDRPLLPLPLRDSPKVDAPKVDDPKQ